MTYTINPVAIEISKGDDMAAKVTVFDSGAASIEITTVVNANEWRALAEAIRQALVMCNLDGDAP